ncbi:MAG: Gfo/Idh/MocA family oxidoreductase [Clostridia bacterium]|nr:Gfo/Idh/MocA family oxidoreductase [Clostridia bacterium]MBR3715490.1 Gfo/Idh/MocA family oxidoreductase [Clostridia bacterium]
MKKLRVGVFGAGRGADIAGNFMMLGCEIVAICDFHKERREDAAKRLGGIAQYEDFDSFIEHGMDAVIMANFFHEHAPYTIKCFEKGIHVFGECISNGTMAEGVELIKAFEKSNSVYMLAENYPQMIFNREMKRVCDSGTLGKILYAEGEYNHPGDPKDVWFNKTYVYFEKHWRNFLPRTYYITHSLGPVMRASGATPKRVTAFASFAPFDDDLPSARYVGDKVAIVTTQNDDGSVFRITGCAAFGAHHNAYRICGTKGQIENLRGMGPKVMLRYNGWEKPEGANEVELYEPKWNDKDEELIIKSGHGGGDYLTARMFVECVREGKQPEHPFDIYSAVNMSSVAILAHRSMLEGGKPYDIPDFREEKWCKMYENDRLTPFYGTDGSEPTLPCCSVTDFAPTETQIKLYRELLGIK